MTSLQTHRNHRNHRNTYLTDMKNVLCPVTSQCIAWPPPPPVLNVVHDLQTQVQYVQLRRQGIIRHPAHADVARLQLHPVRDGPCKLRAPGAHGARDLDCVLPGAHIQPQLQGRGTGCCQHCGRLLQVQLPLQVRPARERGACRASRVGRVEPPSMAHKASPAWHTSPASRLTEWQLADHSRGRRRPAACHPRAQRRPAAPSLWLWPQACDRMGMMFAYSCGALEGGS